MRAMRARQRRLLYAALLALGLHVDLALVFVLLLHGGTFQPRPVAPVDEAISLETIDPAEAQELLAELDRAEEAERQKELEATQAPGQVVELPEPANPERPDEARFVAEHDSKVDRETRRTGRSEDPRPPSPALLAMRAPAPAAPQSPAGRAAAPMPPGVSAPEAAPRGPLPDPDGALSAAPAAGVPEPQPGEVSRASKDAPGELQKERRPVVLVPSAMQLARAIGGGTPDHLVDVDEGPGTSLNAKQWKFASFFNRVKRQVAQHWRPGQQYEKRDPSGNIYGNGQWVTLLQVTLKPDGSLAGVVVAKPSGLEFLDDEAVEAIKRGQPYPNPPPQLVTEGLVGFRFGFFFDVNGGPRMKMYRYSRL